VRNSLLKRAVVAGATLTAALVAIGGALPAGAQTVTPQSNIQITAVGSDTTQKVMDLILAQGNAPAGETWTNVSAYQATPLTNVGIDANCAQGVSFYIDQPTATAAGANTGSASTPATSVTNLPYANGSGGGRTQLTSFTAGTFGNNQKGCVDIARSSSYNSSAPGTGAGKGEFFAFALDAVSWATTSPNAPATLTKAQINDIYTCAVTDWSQLGGSPGKIQRYLPQTTSGTENFFRAQFLNNATPPSGIAGCPDVKRTVPNPAGGSPVTINYEENTADTIPAADWDTAIFPYSAGQWVFQANNATNPTIDRRMAPNGGVKARIGAIDAADHTTDVVDVSGRFKTTVAKHLDANPAAWNNSDGVWQLNTPGLSFLPGYPATSATDFGGYVVTDVNAPAGSSGSLCVTPGTNTTVTCAFPGIRLVYNALDHDSPNYLQARAAVGFDNTASGAKSALCSGARSTVISSFGFAPLDTAEVALGSNAAGSTCRSFLTTA
jgi:ABC-type phosphate transport system substrate-binding protein